MFGRNRSKTNQSIALEWDCIAHSRALQLNNHEDISMDYVLIPYLLDAISEADLSNVLDIGCGTGYTTCKIAEKAVHITGIDISKESILEARMISNKIDFQTISIEDFSKIETCKYSLAIANMTLMDVVNLEDAVKSISDILNENGILVITITHPYFWPLYWKYSEEDWFNYSSEIEIEGNFEISLDKSTMVTTHYHRPLGMYFDLLVKNNFEVISISEPIPTKEIITKYPQKWKYPRFLGIKCRKKKSNT